MKQETRKDRVVIDRGIHRATMLEMGVYNAHKARTHEDKSKYTRKQKHKGRGEED